MNFKRPKEEVIERAYIAADSVLYSQLHQLAYAGASYSPNGVISMFQMAMSHAIKEAIRSVVEDTYSHDEFERDLGIKE